ncbi:MAG: R-phenyllactate dehydratase activator [Syntrophorhabdus sp. PtaB.Bin047]|nr:MAG: R-phenyllactate dehydratase activator [Syntrophorhabdus sp. PtaB.Bin047]
MRTAGLDIGSRTVKLVVIEQGETVLTRKGLTSHDPLEAARALMEGVNYDTIVATGYGRHLLKEHLDCPVISEIKAFALGAKAIYPTCRVILDIGGQDTKAISLNEAGEMSKFEMNDKCAAGTGRFLEIMAAALGYTLEEFPKAALSAGRFEKINSMCTVFAESEVISLTAKGAARPEVALGIHRAIVSRSTTLLKRIAPSGEVFFAGGVALNGCVETLIAEDLGRPVFVPPDPQMVGALGAALHALKSGGREDATP